jgi:pimeloyl-ACP methyl ester carboxylesterase
MLEPYQPGKIPVVMVHGLLSSPTSWIDLANDLRAAPGFTEHFQLWGFRYATGKPFLESAARMRRDLYRAVATVDPCGEDAALRNLVLVGHSMGGLVCKLQAASSEDRLWYAVANRPPEAIVTSEQTRQQIRELFFFEPQSNVRRVIYLATPHRGSTWAARPIGLAVGSLTRPDPARVAQHDQLVADNPDVFIPQITNRIPTSIDMLNPNNPLLPVIATLPTSPCVRFNSIYGYGCFDLEGPGDGIVSVNSTLTGPEESRLGVRATHTRVHRVTETTVEVLRILGEHYCEFQSLTTPEVLDSARSEPQ